MYQHSSDALEAQKGSSWDLDRYAEQLGWRGVGVALAQHRDSDVMDRSNWRVIVADFGKRFGGSAANDGLPKSMSITRLGHWAVGWMEWLTYDTADEKVAAAVEQWQKALREYPVADEDDYSQLQIEDNHPGDGLCYCTRDESDGCEGERGQCGCGLPSAYRTERERLEDEALASASRRKHSMGDWQELTSTSAESLCVRCRRGVVIDTKPAANGIDIGGEAVAVDCDAQGATLGL